MRREIEVTDENREFLRNLFGVTDRTMRNALKLDGQDTDVRQRIRKAALERGGEIMVTLPEFETIHDADGMMIQTFQNGARLEINKRTGETRVLYKGDEVDSYVIKDIPLLYEIQIMANGLGKKAKERS